MKENLKALTSLRFFAAAAIVIHHTTWYFGYGSHLANLFPLDLGVSFFFILSGFVLYYAHPDLSDWRAAINFIVARIARVWPAHLAMLSIVIIFLARPWGTGPSDPTATSALLANVILLQSWYHLSSDFFSFNGVSWSISTEMFFYAMFPILIWRWDQTKYFKLVAAGGLAIGCVLRAAHLELPLLSDKNVLSIDSYVYIFPPARLFEFAVGIFTADLWAKYSRYASGQARSTVLQAAALVLLVIGVPKLVTVYAELYRHHYISKAAVKWLFGSGSAPIFAFVIFAMASSKGLFAKALSWRPLVILGEISFSIYMTHQVLIVALTYNGKLASLGAMPFQYAAYWTIVILFSAALWLLIEKPCRKWVVATFKLFFMWPLSKADLPVRDKIAHSQARSHR
ncbi:O-acetyltransferase OatA [Caballeronia terrestris]|uniref:O-acetyltransferase OatA n=1 Tax=Caballeronia terrestris TaxID=1226301 RepID=A0A158IUS0_9BURK|nr:acyltransferase [Caballeronia terrestris]SAL60316.1 O-acetyltransferase OatA [Caballeronia terrestris]